MWRQGSHGALLEQAILGFLEQLRLAYLVDITRVLSTTQRAKFEQFYTALSSFCGTTMGHEQILSSIVVKLSSNLRQFADNAAITEACIELINQLSCHSFTGKLMKHLNIIGAIMSLTAVGARNLCMAPSKLTPVVAGIVEPGAALPVLRLLVEVVAGRRR